MIRTLELFAGIGGIGLGLERTGGFQVVGQCEIDPFCREVLAKHWPHVWRHDDIGSLTAKLISDNCGAVDCITGGFPCQDISAAGKGAGIVAGERSSLWWQMFRIIATVRPTWIVAENVPALRTRGADDVIAVLEAIGYSVWPVVVGAWAVGAPHKRDRVWIVANSSGRRNGEERSISVRQGRSYEAKADAVWPSNELGNTSSESSQRNAGSILGAEAAQCGTREQNGGQPHGLEFAGASLEHADRLGRTQQGHDNRRFADGSGETVADPEDKPEWRGALQAWKSNTTWSSQEWPARPGEQQYEWEESRLTECEVGDATDGLSARLVRFANRNALKAGGNSVVPQTPEAIGRAILRVEASL